MHPTSGVSQATSTSKRFYSPENAATNVSQPVGLTSQKPELLNIQPAFDCGDVRQRSNSFHTRTATHRPSGFQGFPTGDPLSRLNDHHAIGRTGSVENISHHSAARLTHSKTVSEIPVCREGFSNDSGYDTPPFQRPYTSPTWASNQKPQWTAPFLSQPPGVTGPQPVPYSTASSQPPAHNPNPVPYHQRLSIDVGHFEPEPSPTLEPVGTFMSPQPNPYSRIEAPYSTPPRSSPALQEGYEEGVIGYQRERMLRLGQAYDTVEGELKNLEEDISSLQHQYHQLRGDSSSSVDLDTEAEVDNLRKENSRMQSEIKELMERIRSYQQPPPTQPAQPVRPPPPVIMPQRQPDVPKWSCLRCTYENHGLVATCEMCDTARPPRGPP